MDTINEKIITTEELDKTFLRNKIGKSVVILRNLPNEWIVATYLERKDYVQIMYCYDKGIKLPNDNFKLNEIIAIGEAKRMEHFSVAGLVEIIRDKNEELLGWKCYNKPDHICDSPKSSFLTAMWELTMPAYAVVLKIKKEQNGQN